MSKIIRLTESDLIRLVTKIITEDESVDAVCFDTNIIKKLAQKYNLKIFNEGNRIYAESMNGQIGGYLYEPDAPYKAHTTFSDEITFDDLDRIKIWNKQNGGNLLETSGTYRNTYERPMMVAVFFEGDKYEPTKCGDYQTIENVMKLMNSFIKFMGPNFKKI